MLENAHLGPNLQTISAKLQLSESMASITLHHTHTTHGPSDIIIIRQASPYWLLEMEVLIYLARSGMVGGCCCMLVIDATCNILLVSLVGLFGHLLIFCVDT